MSKPQTISDNRKARFDFFIEDKFESGIELLGWEVKSARAGNVNLADSFVFFESNPNRQTVSAVLKNAYFAPYEYANTTEQNTRRDRRLLLNRSEINKIHNSVKTKGATCVPTRIFFNSQGRVKIEIAIARGKHTYDKKRAIKERDILREAKNNI